ncbi:MAG: hypothetical protein CL696_04680 [Chloroflexi bacterium]|jgi:hypothetical protein|nr:hypothetical protein [Chloroflexota bacterium]MDP6498587.1 hypothetical protein [Dehalococcoidia bacterium]MQG55715.1 hypothetical protein [SAR202 cluster bacterium]
MLSKKQLLMLIVGIFVILAMACGSDEDAAAVSASDGDGVAPAYESRSFDEVKPQNVDLNLVPTPLCRRFRTATVTPRTSG